MVLHRHVLHDTVMQGVVQHHVLQQLCVSSSKTCVYTCCNYGKCTACVGMEATSRWELGPSCGGWLTRY